MVLSTSAARRISVLPEVRGHLILPAAEHFASVGESGGLHVGQFRAVAREVAVDGDDLADFDGILSPTGAVERVRRARFDRPVNRPRGVRDVHVEVDVRVIHSILVTEPLSVTGLFRSYAPQRSDAP